MHNVGSIFRSADAFGVGCLYLCGYTPTPPHRDIHKAALGATESVRWLYQSLAIDALNECKADGYRLIAVEQAHGSIPLQDLNITNEKIALFFGNEVSGVGDHILANVTDCVEIPQFGLKHSLNVSVSVGVVLWQIRKSSF
jgi:tRNA G18 (ribose-2'-O)-methylase SpoU